MCIMWRRRWSVAPFVISVSIYPGTIALTLTSEGPVSVASARVNPNTPALLAAYATAPKPPCRPSKLAILMMTGECAPSSLPLPDMNLFLSKYLVPTIIAVKLVCTTLSIPSGSMRVNRLVCVIPAQFTRTSILRVVRVLP